MLIARALRSGFWVYIVWSYCRGLTFPLSIFVLFFHPAYGDDSDGDNGDR